jgi:hypothetical protein
MKALFVNFFYFYLKSHTSKSKFKKYGLFKI